MNKNQREKIEFELLSFIADLEFHTKDKQYPFHIEMECLKRDVKIHSKELLRLLK